MPNDDPADRPLTELQQRFVAAYTRQLPGSKNPEAALKAAGSTSQTRVQRRVAAARLLRTPHIQREIMRLDPRHDIELAGINAAWLLNELASLWDVELGELFDEDGQLKPIQDISPAAQKLIAGFEVSTITIGARKSGQAGDDGQPVPVRTKLSKVKLVDRLAILRDIGKHVDVSAFNSSTADQVNESLASLMRAATRAIERGSDRAVEIDVSPGTPVDVEVEGAGHGLAPAALEGERTPLSVNTQPEKIEEKNGPIE